MKIFPACATHIDVSSLIKIIQVYLCKCLPFSFFVYRTRGVVSHPFPPRNEFPLLRPNRHVPGCFLRPYAPGAIAHSAKIALHCASWRRYATACSSNFGHWTSLDMWPEPRVHKVSRNSGCLHIRRAKGVMQLTITSARLNVRRWSVKENVGWNFFLLLFFFFCYEKFWFRSSKMKIFISWLGIFEEFRRTKKLFVIPECVATTQLNFRGARGGYVYISRYVNRINYIL